MIGASLSVIIRGLYRRFAAALPSGIPTQVVVPSVSLAAMLQGTALTIFVETPSGATLLKPVSD
jgi:hypothetical protein